MGCSVVEETFNDEVKSISYTECFKNNCHIFMSYGMSYDEFWYDDVYKTRYYLKAYKERLKQKDMELWEQGMYIYEAILQCSPILHPFSKAKEPLPYTKEPHTMLAHEKTEEELLQEQENERLKAEFWLRNWVKCMKKNK
mgnify:CR=1 FL=1